MYNMCMASFDIMKPFKTYKEQIEIMRKHNLLPPLNKEMTEIHGPATFHIKNESGKILGPDDFDKIREFSLGNQDAYVEELLQTYGYYNIINQYNKPFFNKNGKYKEHIDFFKLFSLQQIDAEMKNIIFYRILQIEQRLKACISYEFAKAYGPFEEEDMSNYIEPYFKKENYNQSLTIKGNKPKYEFLIEKLKKIYGDYEYKPFKHYKSKHKHIPIWVFINKLMFGQMIHFYNVLKIQPNIATKFNLTPSQLRTMMLFLNQVRNDCAHFSGFYNQNYPKIKKDLCLLNDFQKEFNFTEQKDIPNIFILLIIFKYLLPSNEYSIFLVIIEKQLFNRIFEQYIPQISEYMEEKLSIKTAEEYKKKLNFLYNYIVK